MEQEEPRRREADEALRSGWLARLGGFAGRWRLPIPVAALAAGVTAAAFGASVSSHLDPYNADDSASQSVKARHELTRAAGYSPEPNVIALVSAANGIQSPLAR